MLQFLIRTIVADSGLQQSFFVIPSDLKGMDLMTLPTACDHNASLTPYVR